MKKSNLFRINWRDVINGSLLAALASVLFFIQESLEAGVMHFNWRGIAMSAVAGVGGYLIKNYFTAAEPKKREPFKLPDFKNTPPTPPQKKVN